MTDFVISTFQRQKAVIHADIIFYTNVYYTLFSALQAVFRQICIIHLPSVSDYVIILLRY